MQSSEGSVGGRMSLSCIQVMAAWTLGVGGWVLGVKRLAVSMREERAHTGAAQHARMNSRARPQPIMDARVQGGDPAWLIAGCLERKGRV